MQHTVPHTPDRHPLLAREDETRGAFLALEEDGVELGYMTYQLVHDEGVIVDHTIVHPEGRGRGVGKRLFAGLLAWVDGQERYLVPVCPFILRQLDARPDEAAARAVRRGSP